MKMKIGIMTFWWSDNNYGQLLQCYALQQYLREQGHEPFLIKYDPRNDYLPVSLLKKALKVFNPEKLKNYIIHKLKISRNTERQNHQREFDSFRKNYIHQSEKIYLSYSELKENPPEADCYIVGSDQVWNFYEHSLNRCKNLLHAYFLDFGSSSTKRISYSASWGKNKISKKFIKEITPLLKKFDYVSVREESGLNICRKCGFPNAEFRCDPTLLLSSDHYRKFYQPEEQYNNPRKYVFVYRLSNPCNFDIKAIKRWAKEKNLEIVYVTANGLQDEYEKLYPTIPQWLSLIDHAEYVITNSFHCCVFSLLFGKRLGVVPLVKPWDGMNTRIDSLFGLFHIEPRWFMGNFDIIEKSSNLSSLQIPEFKIEAVLQAKN